MEGVASQDGEKDDESLGDGGSDNGFNTHNRHASGRYNNVSDNAVNGTHGTYKSQITLEPVLHPRSVTMWLRMESYSTDRCSLFNCMRG
jgi:hypothetical protein